MVLELTFFSMVSVFSGLVLQICIVFWLLGKAWIKRHSTVRYCHKLCLYHRASVQYSINSQCPAQAHMGQWKSQDGFFKSSLFLSCFKLLLLSRNLGSGWGCLQDITEHSWHIKRTEDVSPLPQVSFQCTGDSLYLPLCADLCFCFRGCFGI